MRLPASYGSTRTASQSSWLGRRLVLWDRLHTAAQADVPWLRQVRLARSFSALCQAAPLCSLDIARPARATRSCKHSVVTGPVLMELGGCA